MSVRWLTLCLAVFFGAPLLYAVAYMAAVKKTEKAGNFEIVNNRVMYAPEYRIGGGFSHAVFGPAYSVDTMLRPQHWGRRAADPYDVEIFP